MSNIEESIRLKGIAMAATEGDSMQPLFKSGDIVVIGRPNFPLKVLDIPVYHRDDHLTMHRIIKVKKNGYIICGDNRDFFERDIKDKDIIGVLSGFYQNGEYRSIDDAEYISYCKQINKRYYQRYVKDFLLRIISKLRNITKGGR